MGTVRKESVAPSPVRLVVGRFGFVLVLLVCAELALEFRHHLLGWDTLVFPSVRHEERSAASDGAAGPFRGRLQLASVGDSPLTVWIASSSHAEDRRMPLKDIFPTRLEALLDDAGVPARVINASRAGMTVAQNTQTLTQYGPQWQPDIVILYQGMNDINALSNGAMSADAEPDRRGFGEGLRRLLQQTSVYTHLRSYVGATILASAPLHDRLPPAATQRLRTDIAEFVDVVEALGAEPVLVTFASRYPPEHVEQTPYKTRIELIRWNEYLSMAGWSNSLTMVNEVIRETAEQRDLPLVDASSRVTGEPAYFRDFSHFTAKGHAQMAELLTMPILSAGHLDTLDFARHRDVRAGVCQ